MKINWKQSGMPDTLISRMGLKSAFADYKSVLSDAQNQIMTPVDAEAMARELVQANGREYVEMVRELSTDLANTKKELEEANRRYERLTADLKRRGISIDDRTESPHETSVPKTEPVAVKDETAEWEEWDRKFQSLLA